MAAGDWWCVAQVRCGSVVPLQLRSPRHGTFAPNPMILLLCDCRCSRRFKRRPRGLGQSQRSPAAPRRKTTWMGELDNTPLELHAHGSLCLLAGANLWRIVWLAHVLDSP